MRLAVVLSLISFRALADDAGVGLTGRWDFPERSAVVRFEAADGGWRGVIERSTRPDEVGFELFSAVKEDGAGALRGTLKMPENGLTHDVRLKLEGQHLEAVVGAGLFSKRLRFTRVR